MPDVLPTTYGTADWTNNVDKWREQDAEWLQARSVLRYADVADAATDTPTHTADGSVAFVDDADKRFVGRVSGSWQRFLTTSNLSVPTDSGTSVLLRHASGGTGLALGSDGGVSVGGALTVTGASSFTGAATFGTINVGSVGLSMNGSGQAEFSGTVKATSLTTTSGISGASIAVTGAASAASLTVSGTFTANGTVTGSGSVSLPEVTGTSFVVGGSLKLSGTTLTHTTASSPSVAITSGSSGTLTLKVNGGGKAVLDDGSSLTAPVASYVVSASAPVAEDYPDGTIWLQV